MTYSFADPGDVERMRDCLDDGEVACELLNPMSVEQSILRRSLLPGLMRSVSYNQRRGVPNIHLYEIEFDVPHLSGPQAAQGACRW